MDPLGFVLWAFPWGQKNTELAKLDGPEEWQRGQLARIGDQLTAGGDLGTIIYEQVSAGHGVGKSALVSWLILWAISTFEHTRGVVTANTDTQLRTKTWAELGKWFNLFIAKDMFALTATSIKPRSSKLSQTWRIDLIPWSKERTEAFAGLHNHGKRLILIMDEGSAIDDKIYEVSEGALTDSNTQIIWCVFGNPTKTSGRFYEAMTGQRPRWHHTQVDSRTVRFSNKKLIQTWLEEYGEDSDFFRVRVRGMAPRAGVQNFISVESVTQARRRTVPLNSYNYLPVIIACDQAYFGGDKSVITVRQGAKIHKQIKFSGLDNVELSNRIIDVWREYPATISVCIELAGLAGTGLFDILKRVQNCPVQGVNVAQVCQRESEWLNMRAQLWGMMRSWLESAEIPDDNDLCKQLTNIEFGYTGLMKVQLESKKDMKARGLDSPDEADSIALSFFPEIVQQARKIGMVKVPVAPRRKVVW